MKTIARKRQRETARWETLLQYKEPRRRFAVDTCKGAVSNDDPYLKKCKLDPLCQKEFVHRNINTFLEDIANLRIKRVI
jgi:hypothetical protein